MLFNPALHGKRGGRSNLTQNDKDGRGVQHRPSVYMGQQPCSYSTAALSCKGCFWHLSSSPTGLRNIKLTWWPSALRFCKDTQIRYTSCFSGISTLGSYHFFLQLKEI